MGKDFKEKYERVCALKDRAIGLVESQLNGNIENVDATEVGAVMDIAKDAAEIIKYMEESCYYNEVTTAMKDASKEEKEHYMDMYAPETNGYRSYYSPIYARNRDSRGRYMYTDAMMYDPRWDEYEDKMRNRDMDAVRQRMYYSSGGGSNGTSGGNSGGNMSYTENTYRDPREGKSWRSRRSYLEMRENGADKNEKNKELEKYMSDIADDMTEFIQNLDNTEKALLKQRMVALANRIA